MIRASTQAGTQRQQPGKLAAKAALVVGGGQTPGQGVGNGRASAITFASAGARVMVADRCLRSAQETVDEIVASGGDALAVRADITSEDDIVAMIAATVDALGTVDILHNNVGVSIAGGDAPITDIDGDAFTRITDINLKGMVLTCKHVLPVMRERGYGVIVNIASLAAWINYPYISYRTSKAGVITLTEHLAITQAQYGIRANAILPGLMNTPMAIENRVGLDGASREDVIAERNSKIPLRGVMGTGWDVAKAAAFLASDDASFITGVALAVDGGQALVRG